jgi:hypothetical protein
MLSGKGVGSAGHFLRSRIAGNFANHVLGNKIANLPEDAEFRPGWRHFELIHPCRVVGARKNSSCPFS